MKSAPAIFAAFLFWLPSFGIADPATYVFTWQGAGGYRMDGAVRFQNNAPTPIWTQDDVQCFEVFGYRDDASVGQWFLSNRTPDTTWVLNFDPSRSAFVVVGDIAGLGMPQAWNMDGFGYNCGPNGFGFNLASFAQDLCIDGDLIEESQVPPPQPLPATLVQSHDFTDPDCAGPLMLSGLRHNQR